MNSIKVDGQCYKTRSSQFEQGTAHFCLDGDIVIRSGASSEDEVIVSASINDVRISNKLGNTPREILFPSGELFSFQANEAIETWLAQRGNSSRVGNIEKSKAVILSSLVIVPVMVFLLFTRVIPYVAIEFSEIVPDSLIAFCLLYTSPSPRD